jgi:hypothetical protein
MNMTADSHPRFRAAVALILVVGAAGAVEAATCKDELDRFERRLHSSALAATDPDNFQALVRQAEEAAELRDEEQCLQSVATLNAALPEDSEAATRGTPTTRSRPAAPVLMMAGGNEADSARAEEKAAGDAEGEGKQED